MANPYSVKINSVATDGTNVYVKFQIFDGLHTSAELQTDFPANVSAATINSYMQTVANNQPALTGSLGALVSTTIQGQ